MRKTVQICEAISEWTGNIVMWLGLALVLLLTWEVFMRYVLQSPTIYSYEYSTMLGVAIGAGGMGFAHKYHGHVRVDVFWRLMSPRGRAISDAIASIIFFFPFIIIVGVVSTEWAVRAFVEGELLTKTYLYPPAWPIRTVMALAFFLFVPQGIAKLIRDLHMWIKKEEI